MKIVLLSILSLVIINCGGNKSNKSDKSESNVVDMKFCHYDCLDRILSRIKKVDGEAVKEFKLSCKVLFENEKCCKYNSWYRRCY